MQTVEIQVKGEIEAAWSSWFGDFSITRDRPGISLLTGSVHNQAELRSIVSRISDLGLELLSLNTRYTQNL